MHIFYTPDICDNTYVLDEGESKHCIRVLRLSIGDEVFLVNGKGGFYRGEIVDDHPKRCTIEITDRQEEYGKRNFRLHIALAPTKNIERTEWFIEKATEIGIDEITPVICRHSERKAIKPERLNKIITSAVKQSVKAYYPILNEQTDFIEFVNKQYNTDKFIAYCGSDEAGKNLLKEAYKPGKDALIMIGPEGDFCNEEIIEALRSGFKGVSLGNSRLRTETAAIVACHTVNLVNE